MKLPLFVITALALGSAHADLTITQKVEHPENPAPTMVTMKIKDGKIRSDASPEISAIIDPVTGDTLTLMHKQKMAMKVPGSAIKAMQAQVTKEAGDATIPEPKPTGRKETISGFECEEFTTTYQGQKIEVWMAKDVPESDEIVKQLSALSESAGAGASFFPKSQMKGLPVRSSVEVPGQGKMTMTIVSINRDPLPASDFKIPAGYQEMAMPAIPGQ
jgi:hypothetical protein